VLPAIEFSSLRAPAPPCRSGSGSSRTRLPPCRSGGSAAVNISTRYLHKLFEADHHTVSLYIKDLRLDRARRDLLDPRLAGRPISAIAYACGFGDLSGFNRAFKEAYALSPKELRNASATRW
jgi:AraC-like DNA-binding protein